jgi:hypothetical protein
VVGIYKSSTIPYVSRSVDFTHGTAIVLIWLVAEVTATVVAASIPFYRPPLRLVSRARTNKESKRSSYAMGGMSSHGHSKLGSRNDVNANPGNFPDDDDDDDSSDRNDLPLQPGAVPTAEYDTWSTDGGNGISGSGNVSRHEMC